MTDKPALEVYWTAFAHPVFGDRPLYLAATARGLCRITWPHESFETLRDWVTKYMPGAALTPDRESLSGCVRQLKQYLDGTLQAFDLPFDLRGTAFQTAVWQALTRIPYGQTWSYSDIAASAGSPSAVRAAGAAIGANPVPIIVPCHRVIGKNATLTGFRGGLNVKEALLRLEGYRDYVNKGHTRFRF